MVGRWWHDLDRILRGDATKLSALRRETIEVAVGGLSVVLLALAALYGACMGSFAIFRGDPSAFLQWMATIVKVPALFVLTLAVTFPSLYVFNALVGSRLRVGAVLRLLVAAIAVTVAVLASLGPIVAFFSVSTTSYAFILLLNVAVFTVAGVLGNAFLLQTLHRLSLVEPEVDLTAEAPPGEPSPPPAPVPAPAPGPPGRPASLRPPGVLEPPDDRALSRHVKAVFRCWIILYGLVGAQMGWVLRPFIGSPGLPFSLFRPRQSNVFQGVFNAIANLFS
jgi:hypothetical protein